MHMHIDNCITCQANKHHGMDYQGPAAIHTTHYRYHVKMVRHTTAAVGVDQLLHWSSRPLASEWSGKAAWSHSKYDPPNQGCCNQGRNETRSNEGLSPVHDSLHQYHHRHHNLPHYTSGIHACLLVQELVICPTTMPARHRV